MTGHTPWREIRKRLADNDPGFEKRVARARRRQAFWIGVYQGMRWGAIISVPVLVAAVVWWWLT